MESELQAYKALNIRKDSGYGHTDAQFTIALGRHALTTIMVGLLDTLDSMPRIEGAGTTAQSEAREYLQDMSRVLKSAYDDRRTNSPTEGFTLDTGREYLDGTQYRGERS